MIDVSQSFVLYIDLEMGQESTLRPVDYENILK